jgi:hypothetical protein
MDLLANPLQLKNELKRSGVREALRRVTIVHRDLKNSEVVHFTIQTKQSLRLDDEELGEEEEELKEGASA